LLVLSFDTATDAATSALVELDETADRSAGGERGRALGERTSRAVRILEDVDTLLSDAGLEREDLEGIAVGTGPGSYTGLRMGLVTARTLAFALDVPVAGVSTLDALAAGAPGAIPVLDARRGEVFTLAGGEPRCLGPADLAVEPGIQYVGDGAIRYRALIEGRGGLVPSDEDGVHVPHARFHALLAGDFGPADHAAPIYLRVPDAARAVR
jgi:tRNA threonylcarbamoyladenosine biosynthesis protein TsaB